MDLRAPRRSPPPRRGVNRDRAESKETFTIVIISLLCVIAILAPYIHAQSVKTSNRSAALAQQTADTQRQTALEEAATQPVRSRQSYSQAAPEPVYRQPAAPSGPTPEQVERYNSMQAQCYRMANMNAQGEYPALQQAACNDYAKYAYSIGVDAGQLPRVMAQAPQQRAAPQRSQQAEQANNSKAYECSYFEQLKESINSRMRQSHSSSQADYFRAELRKINDRIWELNCRNH